MAPCRTTIPRTADIELEVLNTLGQSAAVFADGRFHAGNHVATWNGQTGANNPAGSGIYFYQLQIPTTRLT